MKIQSFILGLLVMVAIQQVSGQPPLPYHCKRNNAGCKEDAVGDDTGANTAICGDDGVCSSCDGGFGTVGCLNHDTPACDEGGPTCDFGQCHGATCECDEGYIADAAGTACKKRVELKQCSATTIDDVSICPYAGVPAVFDGKIYAKNFGAVPNCVVDADGDPGCYKLKTDVVWTIGGDPDSLTPECGVTLNDDNQPIVEIVIQYAPDRIYSWDQLLQLKCVILGPDDAVPAETISVTALADTELQTVPVVSDPITDIIISLKDPDCANPLTGALSIGTRCCLSVSLPVYDANTQPDYRKIKVRSIVSEHPNDDETDAFVTDGCAQTTGLPSLKGLFRADTDDHYVVNMLFDMFMYPDSLSIDFSVITKLCNGEETLDGLCDDVECDGDGQLNGDDFEGAGKRKRRQTSVPTESRLNVSLVVIDPFNRYGTTYCNKINSGEEDGCLKNMVFLLPLVLLTVLLLVSVCMSLFFCLKVTRNRPHSDTGRSNMAYKS